MRKVYKAHKFAIETESERAEALFWMMLIFTLIIVPTVFVSVIPISPWIGMAISLVLVGITIALAWRSTKLAAVMAYHEQQIERLMPIATLWTPVRSASISRTSSEDTVGQPDADGARMRMKPFTFRARPN